MQSVCSQTNRPGVAVWGVETFCEGVAEPERGWSCLTTALISQRLSIESSRLGSADE